MDTPTQTFPSKSYALEGKIMLTAIIILFSVILLVLFLHIYARYYFFGRHRHRHAASTRRHVIFYSGESPCGLESTVLASLPVLKYAPGNETLMLLECAVCLSEFETGEKVRFLPKCGHGFHVDCIDMWFCSHATCPVCRSLIEKIENEVSLPGQVEPGSNSDLCATCRSHAIIKKTNVEKGSSSELCARCHSHATVEKLNFELGLPVRVEYGPSSGSCASCHSKSLLGDWRKDLRIEVPRRTEFDIESGVSSTASQRTPGSRILSLKRIFSTGTRSTAVSPMMGGDGLSCELDMLDLESGVNKATQQKSPAHTPR